MEGNKIYEDSLNELKQIRKHLSSDSVVITMKNLDENTKEEMTRAIQNVIANRYSKVENIVLGVK